MKDYHKMSLSKINPVIHCYAFLDFLVLAVKIKDVIIKWDHYKYGLRYLPKDTESVLSNVSAKLIVIVSNMSQGM